jgi:hypothetical protein
MCTLPEINSNSNAVKSFEAIRVQGTNYDVKPSVVVVVVVVVDDATVVVVSL